MTKNFPNNIKYLRKNAGYKTAKKAAESLKISPGMQYQMEHGDKLPGRNLALKMSKLFNCTLEEIFLPQNTTNSVEDE